jgi:choline oxidase
VTRSADYVIAGGGTAGAVIARRLADSGAEVILLEAGPSGEHDPKVRTLSRWDEMIRSELDYDYRIEPETRGNDLMRYSSARVLGGCSAHNTCIAFQAPDWDMDEWASLGATGWDAAGAAPWFARVLSQVNMERPAMVNGWALAFLEAGRQAGLPVVDFREPNVREGVGWFQQNRRGPLRESSADAYLFPLADRPANLRVLTEETVLRVLVDDRGDAVGVQTARGPVLAREEVVLCGGTFGSPRLLLLSGIGPAEQLRALGIDPVADLPGVGEHLIDHPEGVVLWEASEEVQEDSSHWESGVFLTLDGAEHPEVMAHFTTMRYDSNTVARGYPTGDVVFSMHPNVTKARSQGVVRLRSADPASPLLIDPRYYSDPDGYDERTMLEGIRLARRLAEQPALKRWIKRELAPGPGLEDPVKLTEYARSTGYTVFHPAGTCKMGADSDPLAVVDPQLRVRGVGRLRVADASVFPSHTTVNPCITVMMVGERCSGLLLGELD